MATHNALLTRLVSVEFSHGTTIDDPHGHLEGKGGGKRHIKLRADDDIDDRHLRTYLQLGLRATIQCATSFVRLVVVQAPGPFESRSSGFAVTGANRLMATLTSKLTVC